MKEIKNAKLSIGRASSVNPREHNNIEIEVRDECFNIVAKIKVSSEGFAHAITGMAMVKCEVKIENEEVQ